MSEKELYQRKKQAQLDEWKAELAALKAKASKARADLQLELNREIKVLESKIREVEAKLSEFARAGEGAWKVMREGMDSAWTALRTSMRDAAAKFRK